MELIDLRNAGPAVRSAALALNAEHAEATSPLDTAGLDALLSACLIAPARPDGRALLIGFGPGAAYRSANYRWVSERYGDFVYIDRVIVGRDLQGQGVGRALYGEVFALAQFRGVPVLCEVNRVPPNPVSEAFHTSLGFAEVGRGAPAPGKEVRYLARVP